VRATTRPVLAALLTVLTMLLPAGAPARAARPGGLEWRPCAEDRTAQCAILQVPVDRADPYSATIGMAVARRPATDPRARIGTLLVNPGGPGGSGVDFALGADAFFSPELRRRFDIVGFDPRGVGRSHPVLCSAALVASAPSPLVTDAVRYASTVAYNRRLAADCRRHTGPLIDHVDALSVVQDMEALRAALGEEKVSFYGASYGTLLGEQYAERHPGRVRAVVLDSVMDHSVGIDGFLGAETDAAQDAFDEFAAWCDRNTDCAVHGRDVRVIWARLLTRAAAGTLRDPYDPAYRMTVLDLLNTAFGSFYDPQWYALGFYLREAGGPAGRTAGPPATDLTENGFAAIFCADWSLPVTGYPDLRARLDALRSRAPQMPVSPLALSAVTGCLGRPPAVADPQRALRPATTPVLLVNARHDPATAYPWAQHVAAQLGPAATLLTYDGWGHVAYGRSGCVTGAVDRYLVGGTLPPRGARCAGVEPDPVGVGGGVGKAAFPGRVAPRRWGYR
jgi:pimeloyl-ACP methyl ester carboxylesterase